MTKENIPCFKPINNHFFDYVIFVNNIFVKIEVKSSDTDHNGAIIFCTNHSSGRNKTIPYEKDDVDYIFVYSLNGYYAFLPSKIWAGRKNLSLRYKKANNNANYLMFSDFTFEKFKNALSYYEK